MKAAGPLAAVLLALPAAVSASAGKNEPRTQRTYWDQLMEGQAQKSVFKGARLMDQGLYEDAVNEFSRAVIAAPNDAQAHRMLGAAYYWTGRVQFAEKEFQESLRLDSKSAQTYLLLGIVHAWKGESEPAYQAFLEAERLEPDRADIQMNLGSMEETMGKMPEALRHYRRAVDIDAEHALYPFQLGMLYRRLGRYEEAVEQLEAALKLFPGFEDALLELGAIHERLEDRKKARDMFEKSVKLKSRDAVARFRLARLYIGDGESEKAVAVLREAFHLTPADQGGGLELSLSYGGAPQGDAGDERSDPGDSAKAKAAAESAPSPPQGPLDLLEKNLKRIPLEQEATLQVDVAFLPKPKLEKAKPGGEAPSALKSALERAGKLPEGSLLGAKREFKLDAASRAERLGQIKKVVDELKQLLDGAPPGAETRFGMNLNFSDPPAERGSQTPGAGGRKAKTLYQPRDVGNDLGLWVKGTGWTALVEEVLAAPGEPMPRKNSAAWWVAEGIGHSALGRSRRAGEAFAEALRLDPKSELAYLGLGVARVISGDEKGAAEAYRRALAINPGNRAAEEGLKWLLSEPVDAKVPEAKP